MPAPVTATGQQRCVMTLQCDRLAKPPTIRNVVAVASRIMHMMGGSPMREKDMRESFGNTPDTSKALRMLTDEGKMNKTGAGGRSDPFTYKLTERGLEELSPAGPGSMLDAALLLRSSTTQ
ncbi:MAG: hypothetical protein WDW36_002007 [Sanguina aurantia]